MRQAVILAAGEGQRLRPFTATKPKAMLSIADKPILGYVVEALAQNGIRNIVLVVGYKQPLYKEFVKDTDVRVPSRKFKLRIYLLITIVTSMRLNYQDPYAWRSILLN